MDELFASGIKLAYPEGDNFIFDEGDETEASKILRNRVHCPSYDDCINWAKYQKNVSILFSDLSAEESYALGDFVGENSEPLVCKLEDGIFLQTGFTMVMFHGDPLMRRVTEIIDRVFEAGIFEYWISLRMHLRKLYA
jgi:hypothetical protein